ncbi:MAG: hypothetical protein Q7U35_00780 [Methanobacteriaceae archaeon]|jgi:hypothetical protein|nr:hypothetical protein [Methanobacteriaceae archaeon]MDP2837226.1 hypothetical protein [Methanobacteriaceae archaeon]MDP3623721.1 hypothetical protein [Methanobacteriaceae archaeon]
MPFLECDNCGGYYELEDGESLDDFDVCQCGGELKYFNSLSNFLDDQPAFYHQNNSNSRKSRGGFGFGSLASSYHKKEPDEYSLGPSSYNNSLSRNASSFGQNNQEKSRPKISKPGFLGRISFLGLFAGLCIVISGCLLSYVLFFDYLYSTAINVFSSTGNVMTTISVLGFLIYGILFVIAVSASAVATFIGGSRSYGDGLLNGLLFGLIIIFSALLYVNHLTGMSLALMSTFVLGSVFVSLTSFGGFVGIAFRKIIFRS